MESEPTPIFEFKYYSSQCSRQPEMMILWPDYPDSIYDAEYTDESCGNQAFRYSFTADNCCRESLDLSLSGGYKSIGTSLDLTKLPLTAKNQQYCLVENATEAFGFDTAYFAANGACLGEFRCISGNKSLLIYQEQGCQGNVEVISLSNGITVTDQFSGQVAASFITVPPSVASIEYLWTTYFPYSLYSQTLDNAADISSLLFNVLSLVLPILFFFKHLRDFISKRQYPTLVFCLLHAVWILSSSLQLVLSLTKIEALQLYCDIASSQYFFYAFAQLLTMYVNTMAVFFLVLRDLKTQFKILVYLIITVVHFGLLGPYYLYPSICTSIEASAYADAIFEWNSSTSAYATFLLYAYDSACVISITFYLFSMDKKYKHSEQKNIESIKRTLLDRGSLFTILAQLTLMFVRIAIFLLLRYTYWPGSDKGWDSLFSATALLVVLHSCISSYSYTHYSSIFRKVLRKKKADSKPKASPKSLFDFVWKSKSQIAVKSSRTAVFASKDNLQRITNEKELSNRQIHELNAAQQNKDVKVNLDECPEEGEQIDLETVKIPRNN